jgi:predicted ATPase/DNA-binding CsgD family transcriptional regulator
MIEIDQPFGKVSLTERERDILRLLTNGLTDYEIAEAYFLTVGTVKWYNRQIYNKLGVRNRTEATTLAQRMNLLGSPSRPTTPPHSKPIHNLPAPLTSFVGRNRELTELKDALLASRLVTLTGPPGTGKTRLALEVAAALLEHYRDGVYFVSLASIQDAHLVASTVAQVLGIKESGSGSILAVLKATLQDKQVLLVLDNFEQLVEAASVVSDLLAAAPLLTVLVTSREVLRLYGEREFPVPPLQLPDPKPTTSAEALRRFEAIVLFTQRAHAAQPTFALSDDNTASVAAICVQLDGLPLAIELAAARIKFYAPEALLLRLSSRLEALGEGARDLPGRQRTLRATLAWSYDLLTPEEQGLFVRLGVFAGGFSAADAEAICEDNLSENAGEILESLHNKSLLRQMQSVPGEPRFMMLETMREYALEKLNERGERTNLEEQHARYFMTKSAEAALAWSTPHEGEWLDWLETQHGNLRATLEWSFTHDGAAHTSFELIANLARFWELRGYFSEGYAWLSKALTHTDSTSYTKAHADAFYGIGLLILRQGDHATAQQLCSEALAICQTLGDKRAASFCLVRLSEVTSGMGDYESALALSHRGFSIACESGDPRAKANALSQIGFDSMRLGNYVETQTALNEALVLFQAVDDRIGIALAQSGLGELAVRQGHFEMATAALQLGLHLREEIGDRWGIAAVLGTCAWAELRQKNLMRAAELLKESILIRKEIGEQGGMAWCLEKLAEIAFINQEAARAARTLGAAARIRERAGSTIDPSDREHYDDMIARLRKELGEAVWEAVWAEGQAMPLDRLMEYLSIFPSSSTAAT